MVLELSLQNKIFLVKDKKAKTKAANALGEKIWSTSRLMVFAAVVEGKLRLLHSAYRFSPDIFSAAEGDTGAPIAFLGDRVAGREPKAFGLEKSAFGWSVVKKVALSELAITAFFKDDANVGKFYKTKEGDELKEVMLPVLLLVPGGLIEWLLLKPRTPMD